MSRLAHIFKEFGRNTYRFPFTVLGSLLSLGLLFLLFDLYWIGAGTFDKTYARLLSDLEMEVFIAEEVAEAQIPEVQAAVAEVRGVASIRYISKQDAREIMHASLGVDLLTGYDSLNPLPRSFIVAFETPYLTSDQMVEISAQIKGMPMVTDLYYNEDWLEKTEGTRSIIMRVGMALGILILVTAVISTMNSIRLTSRMRSEGLAQMRLLGAGRLFLAAPLLIEGFVIGALSAAIGWGVLMYGSSRVTFTQFELVFPHLREIALFCGAAGLLGLVSGYIGVRKLLK
jgi:cell division transport system permease protein